MTVSPESVAPAAPVTRHLADAAGTAALGAALGARLRPGDIIALHGSLGAGKTTFARGLILALLEETGTTDEVPSPTFTLVQTYETAHGPLWHVDLYRLTDPDEAIELGLEDAFETSIVLIEWPDRLGEFLPADRLDIALETGPDGGREILLVPRGNWDGRLDDL